MECHRIGRSAVDSLDYIDLTHRRPVGSYEPKCGPLNDSGSQQFSSINVLESEGGKTLPPLKHEERGDDGLGKITHHTTDTTRHMRNVSQEQTSVPTLFGGNANALAAGIGGGVVVDTHVSGIAVIADGTYHFVLHGGCIVDVLYEAGGGVRFSEGCEGVEKVIALVTVGEDIAGYAHAKEGGEGEEAGESE